MESLDKGCSTRLVIVPISYKIPNPGFPESHFESPKRFFIRQHKLAVAVSGSVQGVLRKAEGKSWEIAGNRYPNCAMLQMLGFRAPGKVNLLRTLGRHCLDLVPTFCAGCFDSSGLLEFF